MKSFVPRTKSNALDPFDVHGGKLYTISAHGKAVDEEMFRERLAVIKSKRRIPWIETPHFAIFHQGASAPYLVVGWWANGNELFTSVSVQTGDDWIEDASRYSFCIHDMEIFWGERGAFIDAMCCAHPSLERYRADRAV